MSDTADVIIIGAGVHGASLAFHLAGRGVNVLLLEKKFVAAGATGRSSGLVRMHYDVRQDSELAWVSFQYFRNWKEMVGGEAGFRRTGFVQLVARADVDKLQANVRMHQRIGIPVMLINAGDVKRLAPSFATEDIELAAYEPESGYAMPSDTANAFIQAARAKGARLLQDCAVTGIQVGGGKVQGVQTTQGPFEAPVLVNAAGAWAGQVNQMVGLNLPYDTWRHDTMFVTRPKGIGPDHPAVIDFSNEMYFRPEGNLTLLGLEDENPLGESPDSDTDHARPGFVERGIDRICKRIPIMEQGALHSAHGGYDGITPDQHPLLGAAGPDGFYLDCGFSGTGFKTSPAVGLCLSELILDGASKTVDLSLYAPQRFAEGKPIVGEYPYSSIWK
ncbi:MAG TPA: FAD-dependent oxidoreductase [Anaerolineales bacterium]|nr:FAD-dependent oxidoreductase [Anaerolineales bacterium]